MKSEKIAQTAADKIAQAAAIAGAGGSLLGGVATYKQVIAQQQQLNDSFKNEVLTAVEVLQAKKNEQVDKLNTATKTYENGEYVNNNAEIKQILYDEGCSDFKDKGNRDKCLEMYTLLRANMDVRERQKLDDLLTGIEDMKRVIANVKNILQDPRMSHMMLRSIFTQEKLVDLRLANISNPEQLTRLSEHTHTMYEKCIRQFVETSRGYDMMENELFNSA